MLLELIWVPSGQFLLLALYLWLSCFDFVSARRKAPIAAANQDNPPWYHPPDFYVTAQEWDDFIKPPKDHNYLEDPIIAPLTTEWYPIDSEVDGYPKHMQKECRVARRKLKNSYKEKIETHLTIDIPPGIMDCGGSVDTSAERDDPRKGGSKFDPPEWLFSFPGQNHFPFPRDSISVRGMLKNFFSATPQIDKKTGEVMVGVSQAEFVKDWDIIFQVIRQLGAFMEKVHEKIDQRVLKPLWPEGLNPIVDKRQRQTRIFRREEIGYEEYFNLKFGGTLSQTADRVTDSEWINLAALMYSHLEKGAPDLLVTYGNIINIVYRGLLPLIMDMMADISVKANDLAVEHAEWPEGTPIPEEYIGKSHPLLSWGFPKFVDFFIIGGVMRQRPEWTDYRYRVEPWPLKQEELVDGVQKMVLESRIEEALNYYNPFPWRGTVRQYTEQRSGSTVFLP
ncbi:hypothetical protein TWF788_000513 [Orbilia oligospora]|uniref:Uncharacterized protein n=1 Tax=Orbilia oligospora TaxID=2813651 RepID=A0A7C8KKJ0_ORBOL|nr:hypothetical protein TWF788_000513 [Orbilia oligospora]